MTCIEIIAQFAVPRNDTTGLALYRQPLRNSHKLLTIQFESPFPVFLEEFLRLVRVVGGNCVKQFLMLNNIRLCSPQSQFEILYAPLMMVPGINQGSNQERNIAETEAIIVKVAVIGVVSFLGTGLSWKELS